MQNNCLRICLQCDRLTPRETLYMASGMLNLETQRALSTATTVYQGLNQNPTAFINNMFEKVTHEGNRVTRSVIRDDLRVPYYKRDVWRRNIRIRGPTLYNDILMDIRELPTSKGFKQNLKVHLRDKAGVWIHTRGRHRVCNRRETYLTQRYMWVIRWVLSISDHGYRSKGECGSIR